MGAVSILGPGDATVCGTAWGISFDPERYELRHAGQHVALRPQACELLAYLLRHRDRVVPKKAAGAGMAGAVHGRWGPACLRAGGAAALHDTGHAGLRTVRGRGYRFVAPVEVWDPLPLDAAPQAQRPVRGAGLAAGELAPPVARRIETPAAMTAGPPTLKRNTSQSAYSAGAGRGPGPGGPARPGRAVSPAADSGGAGPRGSAPLRWHPHPLWSEGFTVVFGAPVAQEDHAGGQCWRR